jgi:hypothetical protein
LVHGEIVELYIAPKYTQECHLLSRICEVVRESRGEEIYSRDPMVLLHHCLYRNDERAWAALSEDAMCGLLTCDSLKTYFEERPDDAACFVWRFQDAHSMVHSACILKVFSECIECLSPDAMRVFAQSLRSGGGKGFLAAYATHAKSLPSKPRAMAFESLGSIITNDDVFDALAFDVVGSLETSPHAEDMLAVLVASPCAPHRFRHVAGHDGVSRLKTLLAKTPVPRRAPYLRALAYIVSPGDADVSDVALQTLRLCGSLHEVFMAGVCLVRALESPDQLGGLLTRAILEKKI